MIGILENKNNNWVKRKEAYKQNKDIVTGQVGVSDIRRKKKTFIL